MPKPRAKLVQFPVRIPEEVHQELRARSERTGIPMARIVRDALRDRLRKLARGES